MYSTMNYSVPEQGEKLRNFSDIFLGIVKKNVGDSGRHINPSHASIVPVAVDFFREMIPEHENPVYVLENLFNTQSPFLPGASLLSIPVETSKCNPFHMPDKKDDWNRAFDTRMGLKMGNVESGISSLDWARVFGQIPSAALIAAEERGFEPVVRIPSFDNLPPNYFNGLVLNHMPEGLETGTIFIDSSVGEYCGKHSNGGRIVVNGQTGQSLGDCSKNVEYIVKDYAGKPTQARDCNFYARLGFKGKDLIGDEIKDFEIRELEENGCSLYAQINFNEKSFLKHPSGPLEDILTIRETQSQ